MKTIRITLSKDGASASVTHHFRVTSWPDRTEWSGDRGPFTWQGRPLHFIDGMEKLERVAAHQAALCGATFAIEDMGGEAVFWTDHVDLPAAPPTPGS